MAEAVEKDRWKFRRRVVFGSLGLFYGMLAYLTTFGQADNAVQLALAQSIPIAVVGIVLTYVGGAVADDSFQLRKTN